MEKEIKKKTGILIIDDHPLFREGLKAIIGQDKRFEVLGEAGNARDGLAMARKIKPDLMTVDLSLPDQNGIELTSEIRSFLPDIPIIIISMHCKIDHIVQAVQAGATGYLLKESASDSLIQALDTMIKGDYFLDSALSNEVAKKLMDDPGTTDKIGDAAYGALTPREQEIMRLLAEGVPRKVIAQKLFITQKTVENHTTKIMNKLNLHSTLELVRYAAKLGLIDVDLWKA
jgi:DNA-binding NarL/FixJ family response regulator